MRYRRYWDSTWIWILCLSFWDSWAKMQCLKKRLYQNLNTVPCWLTTTVDQWKGLTVKGWQRLLLDLVPLEYQTGIIHEKTDYLILIGVLILDMQNLYHSVKSFFFLNPGNDQKNECLSQRSHLNIRKTTKSFHTP